MVDSKEEAQNEEELKGGGPERGGIKGAGQDLQQLPTFEEQIKGGGPGQRGLKGGGPERGGTKGGGQGERPEPMIVWCQWTTTAWRAKFILRCCVSEELAPHLNITVVRPVG